MTTAIITATTSNKLKFKSIGCPITCPTNTRSGATNKATNRLYPIATDTAKSILFLIATRTAVTYSAAPPTSGNRITPVNKGVNLSPFVASSTAPTKISDTNAIPIVAASKIPTKGLSLAKNVYLALWSGLQKSYLLVLQPQHRVDSCESSRKITASNHKLQSK